MPLDDDDRRWLTEQFDHLVDRIEERFRNMIRDMERRLLTAFEKAEDK